MRNSRFEKLEQSVNRFVEKEDKSNCKIVGFVEDVVRSNLDIGFNRVKYRDLISVTFSKVCFFQTELEYYLQEQKIFWRNSCIFLFSDNVSRKTSSNNLFNINRGIVCKIFEDLLKNFPNDIRMSYFFIHQENVYDLLSDQKQPNLYHPKTEKRKSRFLYEKSSLSSILGEESQNDSDMSSTTTSMTSKKGTSKKKSQKKESDTPSLPTLSMFSKLKKVKVGFHNFRRELRNGQEKCKKQWKYGIKVLTFYFDEGKKHVNLVEFFDITPLTDYYLNYSFDNSFNLMNNVSNQEILLNHQKNNLNSNNSKILQTFLRLMKSLFKDKSRNVNGIPLRQTKLTHFLKESLRNCVFIVSIGNKKEMLNMLKFSRNLTFVNQKLNLISKLKNTIMDMREANLDQEDEIKKLRMELKNCVGQMQKLNLALNEKEQQNENLNREKNQYIVENLKLVKKIEELRELRSENAMKEVVKKLIDNEKELKKVKDQSKAATHSLTRIVQSIQMANEKLSFDDDDDEEEEEYDDQR